MSSTSSELKSKSGAPLPGYLVEKANSPAVLVFHEYWGLNEQIRRVVDRYADEGFTAFAPDLYRGIIAENAQRAGELMSKLDWNDVLATTRLAVDALQARGHQNIGVTGFCLGGGLALFAAAKLPNVKAVVPFYGIPPAEKADVAQIRGKVLGHYANIDNWCSPDRVNELEKKLSSAKVPFELQRYNAQHAFANDRRPEVYSKKDADTAMQRSFSFFRAELR